ncbi:hypothetical protein [Thomasclavelia cocleata]|uniref:Spore coat protein YutH n=2 Tax=Thomasclavelia cocleata TaxID=69824 RepID=A0A829Z8C3_9FIRM|nr:hypothetical protein [Thomasclavelia cocleata]MCI9630109.1 hypothetical protein [Thomasclavelia cocleata]GFI40337.1 hypothetical protein IMSAGC017_00369 [Thomasclavelia cocleata]
MVSKLEILQRFYQIYLEQESDYFVYQEKFYYICRINNFTNDYPYYMNSLNLVGFTVVNNCFNRPITMDYILYTYQIETYHIDIFIRQSMIPIQSTVEIIKIKESWCKILDEAKCKIGNYASRISHFEHFVVLSYYYQGLGECAISVLNQIKSKEIPAGIEHFYMNDSYEVLCCPSNFLVASRVKDLATGYKNNLISINELEEYINYINLSTDELIYLYARLLFPGQFMQLAINDDCNDSQVKKRLLNIYQNVDNEKVNLIQAYEMLSRYTYIPKIAWL